MKRQIPDDADYRTLRRLNNKRKHSIDVYEKRPTRWNLADVLRWVGLLSKHTKNMDNK